MSAQQVPDLADVLLALPDGPPLNRETWQIDSDGAASWALRKMGAALAEVARCKQLADDEITRVKAWLDTATIGPQHDADFFESRLIDYRFRLEDANPDLPKTYRVPGGRIARRKLPDRVEVVDEQALIGWALTSGADVIRITASVSALKKVAAPTDPDAEKCGLVTGDGEQVPGVVHVLGDDRYSATPETGP